MPTETARSLFGEILDWMLAPLLLLWPMSVAFTYIVAQSIAAVPYDRSLEGMVRALAQQAQQTPPGQTFALTAQEQQMLRAGGAEYVYFQWIGPGKTFMAGERTLPAPPDSAPFKPGFVQFRDDVAENQAVRVAWLYFELPYAQQNLRLAYVQVAESLENRTQLANEIIRGLILPQFVILPFVVLLVWFGLSRGLLPLNRLQQHIRQRPLDDLSPLDTQQAPEEVAPLLAAFNDLLARLDAVLRQQKRFIADAAHQMKTPLAGLRTQAELAMRQQEPYEVQRSLQQIVKGSERATHLINQLLALAQVEHQAHITGMQLIDLSALVKSIVVEYFDHAKHKSIDLGFEEPDHALFMSAHPVLMQALIANLLDNALRYTPNGGAVTVRVQASADPRFVELEIEDDGPGIPESERALVIERFYRVLGSGQEGSGLGLAIVKEIADLHGAELVIKAGNKHSSPGVSRSGCVVQVTFLKNFTAQAIEDY